MNVFRKPNRVSRPVRVTQRGSSTSYPQPNYKKMAMLRNRYAKMVKEYRERQGSPLV
jgi:ribosome-binding protein aMBF1 (putative translation factor)